MHNFESTPTDDRKHFLPTVSSSEQSSKAFSTAQIREVYCKPLHSLVREASHLHHSSFPQGEIQASALLSIKTGGCPENCAYCPQSAHYQTGVQKTKVLEISEVTTAALKAKESGATRFCMGAAWREVKDGPDFDHVLKLVETVKSLGLETCCTLGMVNEVQALRLKDAGLDFYNHNIDTSPEFYEKIIQTRTFEDRIKTLQTVRKSDIKVCTGGILGMGESDEDRMEFIRQLVNLDPKPESLTVNVLVKIPGTPLEQNPDLDALDVVRVVATLRILSPQSVIRLSAGRTEMNSTTQFLCFLAGANSIFFGEKLLTSPNPNISEDLNLLKKTGYRLQGQ